MVKRSRGWLWWLKWSLVPLGVLAFVLALIGYRRALPDAAATDAPFYALNLLALNYSSPPDSPPAELDIARFLVHVVAAGAAVVAAFTLLQNRRDRWTVGRMRGHVVVAGDSQLVPDLAINYHRVSTSPRHPKVCVLARLDTDTTNRLRALAIKVVGDAGDSLSQILAGATEVVLAGHDDAEAVRLVTSVAAAGVSATTVVRVLVDDPALATELRLALAPKHPGFDICCTSARLATYVLSGTSPYDGGEGSVPPVVIGEGPLAQEAGPRLVSGWQPPAQHVKVTCLRPTDDWIVDPRVDLAGRGELTFVEVPWSARAVARIPRSPGEGASVPGLVVVAGLDDAAGFTVASRVAAGTPNLRVVLVAQSTDGWSSVATHTAPGSSLHIHSTRALLSRPEVLALDPERLLATELAADLSTWPGERLPVASTTVEGGVDACLPIARALLTSLHAQGFHVGDDDGGVVLAPSELRHLADAVAAPLGADTAIQRDLVAFVARTPLLAARAGLAIRRPAGRVQLFTAEVVESLARLIHLRYTDTAAHTNNATLSDLAERAWEQLDGFARESNRAQARDIPVKLAMIELDVAVIDGNAADTSWCTDDVIAALGRYEHDRWWYVQLINGWQRAEETNRERKLHALMKSWHELSDGEKAYDLETVRLLPSHLAAVGLMAVRGSASSRGVPSTSC